jgi:hypothetical protein
MGLQDNSRMSLPGVRTTSKASQVTRPAASGARPNHFAISSRLVF